MERVEPFDMNGPLLFCITRDGGQDNKQGTLRKNWHHRERRDFTIREYASFQGYPHTFQFPDTGIGKIIGMIGDSVPPQYSEPIYAEVMKTLIDTDDGAESVSRSRFDYPLLFSEDKFTSRISPLPPVSQFAVLPSASTATYPPSREKRVKHHRDPSTYPTLPKRLKHGEKNPMNTCSLDIADDDLTNEMALKEIGVRNPSTMTIPTRNASFLQTSTTKGASSKTSAKRPSKTWGYKTSKTSSKRMGLDSSGTVDDPTELDSE
jgi:hypothetical protein